MTTRHITQLVAVVCVGLAAGFAGRAAWAAIPDGNTIHGCYDVTGVLRVIDTSAGKSCKAGTETSLDWAQSGTQGSQGIQGPQGDQGATGPAGANGVTGYEIKSATGTTSGGNADVSASCPSGKVATGEGFDLPASGNVSLFSVGEVGTISVYGDDGVTVTAYEVCVDKQQFEGA